MIEFRQVSPYGLISQCERFRIGKYICDGKPVYAAWDGFECIGYYASAADAKKAAITAKKEADRLDSLSA